MVCVNLLSIYRLNAPSFFPRAMVTFRKNKLVSQTHITSDDAAMSNTAMSQSKEMTKMFRICQAVTLIYDKFGF